MSKIDIEAVRELAGLLVTELRDNPAVITPWLSPDDAAKYLGLKPRGLETMRREKRGPRYHRITQNLVRYDVADLDAWIREHGEDG